MSSNFRYYRQAAASVSAGWLQWGWHNSSGEGCLVQALRDAAGSYSLSRSMIGELDGELDQFKDYRLLRAVCRLKKEPLEVAFALWNDLPWRRKQDVLGVLYRLAERQEAEWNETERKRIIAEEQAKQARIAAEREAKIAYVTAERNRLDAEVKELAPKVQALEVKVRELEDENSLLRRLTHSAILRADRRNLEQLSAELDVRFKEIEELPEVQVGA